MAGAKTYRVREMDGLEKLMSARAWVRLVLEERPPHAVLAGVVAMDCGHGTEACLLGWDGQTAIAAPLARLSARLQAVFAADLPTIEKWRAAAQRGDFAAQIARKRKAA